MLKLLAIATNIAKRLSITQNTKKLQKQIKQYKAIHLESD